MGNDSQFRSLGRFLYTQNPFYLISCFLILYGLLITAQANGDLFARSVFLTASIAAYTLLMALTSIGVVRLGKVWEDARSIFLVVIISQVAMSTALDELCNQDWKQAGTLLIAAAVFAVVVTELILRSCRIRLPSWYRLAFYAILLVFFAMPIVMGHAVAERNDTLTSWGAPLFSLCIGGALMLLAPAMRKRQALVVDNGTPWKWPLYPLSAFVIFIVLAVIRSHAIWMSFGFIGDATRFEPFLLLPIALAVLILIVESDWNLFPEDHGHERRDDTNAVASNSLTYTAMAAAPAMLLCGLSREGMTFLPIRAELVHYGGSALSLAMLAVLIFYAYAWVRRVPHAAYALALTLLAISFWGDLPTVAKSNGLQPWMIAALASVICLGNCLLKLKSEHRWVAFVVAACTTIVMSGQALGEPENGWIFATLFGLVAALVIGASFDSALATALRNIAAAIIASSAVAFVAWHVTRSPGMAAILGLMATAVGSLFYMRLVRRWWWLFVSAVHVAGLVFIFAAGGYQSGVLGSGSWPIQSGLLCFVIGVTITSFKTGACQRIYRSTEPSTWLAEYQQGF